VRKYIRLNDFFQKNDKILVYGDLSHYFIKKILKELPIKIIRIKTTKDFNKYKKPYKKVIEYTLDDEINFFLKKLFTKFESKKNNTIKILKLITDEEAFQYAKFHKINFKSNEKNEVIEEFINNLEKNYPDIKFSLLKSDFKLENLLK